MHNAMAPRAMPCSREDTGRHGVLCSFASYEFVFEVCVVNA